MEETIPAIMLIGAFLKEIRVTSALWLLDSPVSNSGRLKTLLGELARQNRWDWDIRLSINPDAELKKTDLLVASTDSVVLDHCTRWTNLGTEIIMARMPEARIIVLA